MLIQSGEAHALLSHSHYLHKSVSRLYIQRHDIDPRSVLFTGPYNYGYILHVTGLMPETTNPRNCLLPSKGHPCPWVLTRYNSALSRCSRNLALELIPVRNLWQSRTPQCMTGKHHSHQRKPSRQLWCADWH